LSASNLGELIALAKRAPGKLIYGSAGNGTPGHLTAEMFKTATAIDMQHVPYKGSAPALSDLLAGRIKIIFDPVQSTLAQVHAGNLRALAISSKARLLALPNVPTASRVSKRQRGGACLRLPSCPPRWPRALPFKLQRSSTASRSAAKWSRWAWVQQ